jgi:hypothetical protein
MSTRTLERLVFPTALVGVLIVRGGRTSARSDDTSGTDPRDAPRPTPSGSHSRSPCGCDAGAGQAARRSTLRGDHDLDPSRTIRRSPVVSVERR